VPLDRLERLQQLRTEGIGEEWPPEWSELTPTFVSERPQFARVYVIEVGFPLRCFRGVMLHRPYPRPGDNYSDQRRVVLEGTDPSDENLGLDMDFFMGSHGLGGYALPTHPLWWGLIVNVMAWSGLLALIIGGVRRVRRRLTERHLARG